MSLRDDYNRDGFYFYKRNDDWLNISRYEEWNEVSFLSCYNSGIDHYISYLKVAAKDVGVQQTLVYIDIVNRLMELGLDIPSVSSEPVLHVMSPALRIPNGYYGTAAHQDWASTQGSLDCATVWIALTDITLNDFPLEVVPGSHLEGLREGKLNGSVLEVEADDKDFVPIECKAGDVIFMSGFLVHRTGKGNGFRVAVSQRFDNASEPTFIERGYPCAQKRVVDREIKWKPTVEQVRSVYAVD